MNDLARMIEAAVHSEERIPRENVISWCREAQDTETLALLYHLTDVAYHRIDPPLGIKETCGLIRRYLLECIRVNPPENSLAITRYEAAWELEVWFDHLADGPPETGEVLRESAAAITQLYLDGDEEIRTAIETGFLEHVLEQERLRPLFEHWSKDERLRESWEAALAWGKGNPGFTKGLRDKFNSKRGI